MAKRRVGDNYCKCWTCKQYNGGYAYLTGYYVEVESQQKATLNYCQYCNRTDHLLKTIPDRLYAVLKVRGLCSFCRNHFNTIMQRYLEICWDRATDIVVEIVSVLFAIDKLQSQILTSSGYWERQRAKHEDKQ